MLHEGACSDTMEHNGHYMLDNNYRCSKDLLDACQQQGTRLLYASSAATYGGSASFREEPEFEQPLNVYGYSKLLFDNVVRRMLPRSQSVNGPQVVGFRYFNVYGPREQHKGRMASVAFHHFNQFRDTGKVKLFGEYGGYGPGKQSRDFVFVDDVVAVNLWFLQHPEPQRHLQPGHRPRPAVQRRGGRHGQRCTRPEGGSRPPPGRTGAPGTHRVHRLSAGARGQVPVLHAGRSDATARDGLRPSLSPTWPAACSAT